MSKAAGLKSDGNRSRVIPAISSVCIFHCADLQAKPCLEATHFVSETHWTHTVLYTSNFPVFSSQVAAAQSWVTSQPDHISSPNSTDCHKHISLLFQPCNTEKINSSLTCWKCILTTHFMLSVHL